MMKVITSRAVIFGAIFGAAVVLCAPSFLFAASAHQRPVANAGFDITGFVGQTITLTGAGSTDSDGDVVGYSWTLVSAPTQSVAKLAAPGAIRMTVFKWLSAAI